MDVYLQLSYELDNLGEYLFISSPHIPQLFDEVRL